MKRAFPDLVLFVLLVVSLAGCGGGGTKIGPFYSVDVVGSPVSPGGTATVEASVVDGGSQGVSFAVREGAAGGTVVQGSGSEFSQAVYTAPATPGTYHVDVAFATFDGSTVTRTAKIVVR